MIIFGGWDGTKTLNDMYELSLDTNIWYNIIFKSDLTPPQVYRHSMTAIGGNIIIFGGINEFIEKFNDLFIMDFENKTWKIIIPHGEYPEPRTYHSISYTENCNYLNLFISGGFSDGVLLNDFYSIKLNGLTEEVVDQNLENKSLILEDDTNNLINFDNNELKDKINILHSQVAELKLKYENEVMKNICKICFEREIDTAIMDCFHLFICFECSKKCLDKCPMCNAKIKNIVKTYR